MAEKQVPIEVKGFVLAIVAGLVVVGLTFGVAAVARKHLLAPASQAASAMPAGKSAQSFTSQQIIIGQQLYLKSCASCHGASAQGAYGPNLRGLGLSDDRIEAIIKKGKGSQMPAFGKQYKDPQIADIVAYLRSAK